MNNKKKICILSFSNIAWDSRVLREIYAAAQYYQVDVIGFGDWQPPAGVRYFCIPKTTRNVRYLATYITLLLVGGLNSAAWDRCFWQKKEYKLARDILKNEKYDLIHANDWDGLPVAVTAANTSRSRVLFDAHEYSVEQGIDISLVRLRKPFREYLLRTFGGNVAKMITVGDGIKNLYQEHFGWDSDVILNAPHYTENQFRPVDSSRINLVHHGGAIRDRYIEDLISMVPALDERFHLNLMLMPTDRVYLDKLKSDAYQTAANRISFLEPVLPQNVVRTLTEFDIGILWLRANNLNHVNALPNKFFDYTMAGLGIAISPLPAMQKIVVENQSGIISSDQSWLSMANALNSLSADMINQFKRNSLKLAKTQNAEVEMQKLMHIYEKVLMD